LPTGVGSLRTWAVRLPVRAERIEIAKSVVVREEIVVKAHPTDRSVLIESDSRREVLRVELGGDATVIGEPIDKDDDRRPS
jgi:stress response protein YsnF